MMTLASRTTSFVANIRVKGPDLLRGYGVDHLDTGILRRLPSGCGPILH